MKNFFLFLVSFLAVSSVTAQNFEGKLVYEVQYRSKGKQNKEQVDHPNRVNKIEVYIKDDRYKEVRKHDDIILSTVTYNPLLNRTYTERPNEQFIEWKDCSYEKKENTGKLKLLKDEVNLLDYTCQALQLKTKDTKVIYYFSDQLSINPAAYVHHKKDQLDEQLKLKKGGLNIRKVSENKFGTQLTSLIEIIPMELPDQVWKINTNKELIPSPRELDEKPVPYGGMKAFYKQLNYHLRYPLEARKQGIEEKVYVKFIVNPDGSRSGFEVINKVDESLKMAALAAVTKADLHWKAGKYNGKAYPSYMILPVVFRLRN